MNAHARKTYITYFAILAAILAVVAYSARNVIFRPWTARTAAAAAVSGGKIYIFGGKNQQNELLQDVIVMDPANGTLKRVASASTGMLGIGTAVLRGAIFLAGGSSGGKPTRQIERFDPGSRRFFPVGRLPAPRAYGALVAMHGRLYYLGGWNGNRASDAITAIDPSGGAGRIVARLPEPLEQFAAVVRNDLVYVIGGENASGAYVGSIYALDLPSGRLVASGKLPTPAARLSASVLDGSIYVAGGWNGSELHTLFRITRAGSEISVKKIGRIGPSMLDAALSSVQGRLYLIGGTEQRYRRQIQVLRVDPHNAETTNVILKSYAWW